MFLLERHQDFAVHRPDGRRIAEGNVDAAIGQTDIVEHDFDLVLADDLADRRFDLGKYFCVSSSRVPGGART